MTQDQTITCIVVGTGALLFALSLVFPPVGVFVVAAVGLAIWCEEESEKIQ